MEEDKNPQQIDWGDSMEDWDSESWATHTRYGGDDDPDTDYSEDSVVNDDFEYWRTLKEDSEYSRNWIYTSRALREQYNYQCQKCYAVLEHKEYLLHVHHRNENKKDNRTSNLIVLCVLCHGEEKRHSHLLNGIDESDIGHIKQQRRHAKPLEPKKRDIVFPNNDDRDEKYWEEMDDLYPDYPR